MISRMCRWAWQGYSTTYIVNAYALRFPVCVQVSEAGLLHGVETRTSAPVRIVRGDDFQSVSLKGMYPCGEVSSCALLSSNTVAPATQKRPCSSTLNTPAAAPHGCPPWRLLVHECPTHPPLTQVSG